MSEIGDKGKPEADLHRPHNNPEIEQRAIKRRHKAYLADGASKGVRECLDSIRGANLFGSGVQVERRDDFTFRVVIPGGSTYEVKVREVYN